MFVLPSRTSKMIKSHEVSNKNFKNRTADNVLKIQSSQNNYPGSSSVNHGQRIRVKTHSRYTVDIYFDVCDC